jgi:hypothetical protein
MGEGRTGYKSRPPQGFLEKGSPKRETARKIKIIRKKITLLTRILFDPQNKVKHLTSKPESKCSATPLQEILAGAVSVANAFIGRAADTPTM